MTDEKLEKGQALVEPQAPVTPTLTPEPTKPVEPTIPQDQLTSLKDTIAKDVSGKVTEEVSKGVIARIGEALGLTKKQEEGLPKDPEALKKVVQEAIDKKFEEVGQQAENEERESEKDRKVRVNGIVNNWFSQYNRLSQSGKVPAIKNANNENDPGIQARKKVILYIGQMIEKLKTEGSDYTPSIADALLENSRVLSGPAGANLPISGNTAIRENEESFKYEDIKGKSFEDIIQGS